MEILTQAERFIESQGFHLLTKDKIPKFALCAAESYGGIVYALDDYFVRHPCTKDELWEMWLFNPKYFYSRALIYSDSPDCNAWMLWIPPGCIGVSVIDFIRHGHQEGTQAVTSHYKTDNALRRLQQLISQGISFLSGLATALKSPESTKQLVDSIVEVDKETGQANIKIPVANKDTVQQMLSLLGKLF